MEAISIMKFPIQNWIFLQLLLVLYSEPVDYNLENQVNQKKAKRNWMIVFVLNQKGIG